MNEKAAATMAFLEEHPQFKGHVVGWTKKDGLGITRIDDRWYECDEYLVNIGDLEEILERMLEANDDG